MGNNSGILAIVGGPIALVASFLPAAVAYISYSFLGYDVDITIYYWFWGNWYASIRASGSGETYYNTIAGRIVDIPGILCGITLIAVCVIGLVIGIRAYSENMDPKTAGLVLLIMGAMGIAMIIIWIITVPMTVTLFSNLEDYKVKFWDVFSIGPGVYAGFIGSGLVLGSGIALVASS